MRKKTWLFIVGVLLILIASVIYFDYARAARVKNDFAFTKGDVASMSMDDPVFGRTADITYKMVINGKELTRIKHVSCEKSPGFITFEKILIGEIDVVYEKRNPDNFDLLLRKSDYEEYYITPSEKTGYLLEALEYLCGKIE